VLPVGSRSRPLPVTLRPLRGEILYSWLARMAGIYDLAPADLLPGAMSWDHLDLLVNGNGAELLARIGVLTRMQKPALLRMTLGGTRRKWPEKWCVAGPQTSWSTERFVPHLQVCSECLNS
jgi:TniQ